MFRRTGAVLIAALLLWISTPALACLVSPEKMTAAEMRCCREMKGHCGEMANVEHSCCPKTPLKAQADKTVLSVVEKYSSPAAAVSLAIDLVAPQAIAYSPLRGAVAGPAESPPGAPMPLRI